MTSLSARELAFALGIITNSFRHATGCARRTSYLPYVARGDQVLYLRAQDGGTNSTVDDSLEYCWAPRNIENLELLTDWQPLIVGGRFWDDA